MQPRILKISPLNATGDIDIVINITNYNKSEISGAKETSFIKDVLPKKVMFKLMTQASTVTTGYLLKSSFGQVTTSGIFRGTSFITKYPDELIANITVSISDTSVFQLDSNYYTFNTTELSLPAKASFLQSQIGRAETAGRYMSYMSGAINNPAATYGFIGLMWFDPTGYFLRFAQILKIFNKLRFIRTDFGPLLQGFLDNLGQIFQDLGPHSHEYVIKNSKAYRGKLSDYFVEMEFGWAFVDKLPIYFLSWTFLIINQVLMVKGIKVGSSYLLYVMRYHPKIHFLIFNIMYADVLFIGTRTIIHSAGAATVWHVILAYLTLIMVCADFFLLLSAIWDENSWRNNLNSQVKLLKYMYGDRVFEAKFAKLIYPVPGQAYKDDVAEGETLKSTFTDRTTDNLSIKPEPEKDYNNIDYEATYNRAPLTFWYSEALGNQIALNVRSYGNKQSRGFVLWHLLRLGIYQVGVVSGQYTTGLLALVLLFWELRHANHTFQTYSATKHIKQFLGLVLVIGECFVLGFFLILIFFIHFKENGEVIGRGTQLFGIVLVMIGLCFEWAVTLTMIVLEIVKAFKDKSLKKAGKSNPPGDSWVIFRNPSDSSHQEAGPSGQKGFGVSDIPIAEQDRSSILDASAEPIRQSMKPDTTSKNFN